MGSYFGAEMGPCVAQWAKESWKAIKKKLLSALFRSVNQQPLKKLKTTLLLRVYDTPFICVH